MEERIKSPDEAIKLMIIEYLKAATAGYTESTKRNELIESERATRVLEMLLGFRKNSDEDMDILVKQLRNEADKVREKMVYDQEAKEKFRSILEQRLDLVFMRLGKAGMLPGEDIEEMIDIPKSWNEKR